MRVNFIIGLVVCLFAFSVKTHASEQLHFTPSDNSPLLTLTALHGKPLEASAIDLNNDGKEEKIFKSVSSACDHITGCDFVVTAAMKDKDITIGHFKGFNLLIADKRTYGIRDILVYNSHHNDFNFTRYVWNPKNYRYEQN